MHIYYMAYYRSIQLFSYIIAVQSSAFNESWYQFCYFYIIFIVISATSSTAHSLIAFFTSLLMEKSSLHIYHVLSKEWKERSQYVWTMDWMIQNVLIKRRFEKLLSRTNFIDFVFICQHFWRPPCAQFLKFQFSNYCLRNNEKSNFYESHNL